LRLFDGDIFLNNSKKNVISKILNDNSFIENIISNKKIRRKIDEFNKK